MNDPLVNQLCAATPDPNIPQKRATVPEHDVWVAASAGSGKTKVLTDRVLRLLLPDPDGRWEGTEPHRILCITFTKAAAALMANRIQNKLGEWTTKDEAELRKELAGLLDAPPTEDMIKAARQLFSKVLDTPGGLSIMTIHSFCQSTLARFPLESGLTPGFRVIDEIQSHELISKSILSLITDIENGKFPHLEEAFNRISLLIDFDQLKSTLLKILEHMDDLVTFSKKYPDAQKLNHALREKLGADPLSGSDELLEKFITSRPEKDLRQAAQDIGSTNTTNGKMRDAILDWLGQHPSERKAKLRNYEDAYFRKGEYLPKKITGKIEQLYPLHYDLIQSEISELLHLQEQMAAVIQADQTTDLLIIALESLNRYRAEKRRLNTLDFGDMIVKTRQLLENSGQEWVHFKLDEGIDHILVDEAQDTNPDQWKIVKYLSAEFQSGWGRETKSPRSIFVVGDKKQSIFSFHGANIESFAENKRFFEERSQLAGRKFDPVNLQTSFRTTPPVLDLVDAVFANPSLRRGLGLETGEILKHYAFEKNRMKAGLVELWDLEHKQETIKEFETKQPEHLWTLPFSENRTESRIPEIDSGLANRIALKITSMIHSGEILATESRPIKPKDIIILVRTRTGSFVNELIRLLKLNNIPVSGIDRMNLNDQIAIEDCLALARFARLPEDDLSLACVLKSPFIRISENTLMTWALNRKRDQSLWAYISTHADQYIVGWLTQKIEQAVHLSPFNFFEETLCCACPHDPHGSARRSFATLLGHDCLDPLDEFLSYCLESEQNGILSLEDLVTALEKNQITIKREMESDNEEGDGQVRIMTVHASKGLEAPIVFMPDTTSKPQGNKIDKFLWVEDKTGEKTPLWSAVSSNAAPLYKQARDKELVKAYEEYLRLLYVAMTRPKERLYICGKTNRAELKESDTPVWYQLIENAFDKMGIGNKGDAARTYKQNQDSISSEKLHEKIAYKSIQTPACLWEEPKEEAFESRFIRPSLMGRSDPAISPLQGNENYRFERGILTHKLFEFLPEIDAARRRKAADLFLKKNGSHLPEKICNEIATEVLSVLNHPEFSEVFGPNSMAEISVTGEIAPGRILSGQIDRLVILPDRILIVDFKSNRPSPENQTDIPDDYRAQLTAYKSAISKIYKGIPVTCALLWTDKAKLMPLDL
ncbi:MAG: double-strand break repair helicase AddA [Pseudobdellovibrionaceae bacterium]|jgi:ATP-dependent helicase/nuclease subunit A|nr:double-strand break repair helicase AddA [Pseudobdellovibrionaceae bacterium]